MMEEEKQNKKYKTKCVFCGREFITERNTANEGICYPCRCVQLNKNKMEEEYDDMENKEVFEGEKKDDDE